MWAGAVIQWLRDELRFFHREPGRRILRPKGDGQRGRLPGARLYRPGRPPLGHVRPGAIFGLTRGTKREHIIRAAQESIAYQVYDLAEAMEADTGLALQSLKADGGASRDTFLMQFQADLLDCEVRRPAIRETTALGAAYLAGLATGVWRSLEEVRQLWACDTVYTPRMDRQERETLTANWHRAVQRSLGWSNNPLPRPVLCLRCGTAVP